MAADTKPQTHREREKTKAKQETEKWQGQVGLPYWDNKLAEGGDREEIHQKQESSLPCMKGITLGPAP